MIEKPTKKVEDWAVNLMHTVFMIFYAAGMAEQNHAATPEKLKG